MAGFNIAENPILSGRAHWMRLRAKMRDAGFSRGQVRRVSMQGFRIASGSHDDEMRRNEVDKVIRHPIEAAIILVEAGEKDPTALIVTLDHDMVEDTNLPELDEDELRDLTNASRRRIARNVLRLSFPGEEGEPIVEGIMGVTKAVIDGHIKGGTIKDEIDEDEANMRYLKRGGILSLKARLADRNNNFEDLYKKGFDIRKLATKIWETEYLIIPFTMRMLDRGSVSAEDASVVENLLLRLWRNIEKIKEKYPGIESLAQEIREVKIKAIEDKRRKMQEPEAALSA